MTWKIEEHENFVADEIEPIQIVDDKGAIVACNSEYYPTQLTRAHADLIVSAVNEVASLREQLATAVEALKEIAHYDEEHTAQNQPRLCCKFQDIALRTLGASCQ